MSTPPEGAAGRIAQLAEESGAFLLIDDHWATRPEIVASITGRAPPHKTDG